MDLPPAPMAPGPAPDAPMPNASPVAQQIADAAKQLPPDDLTTLMHGISPEALEVMEKIPELAMFADLIESGGKSDAPGADDMSPGGKPGIAIMIGVAKKDPRSDVRDAMAKHGMRG